MNTRRKLIYFYMFQRIFFALTWIEKKISEVTLICGHTYILTCIAIHCGLQTFYIQQFFVSFHNRNRCILLRSFKCISMIDTHRLSSKEIQDFPAPLASIFYINRQTWFQCNNSFSHIQKKTRLKLSQKLRYYSLYKMH